MGAWEGEARGLEDGGGGGNQAETAKERNPERVGTRRDEVGPLFYSACLPLSLSHSLPLSPSYALFHVVSTSSLLHHFHPLSLSLSLSPTLDPTVPPLLLPPPHTLRRRPAAPLLTRRGRHTVRTHSTGAAPTVCGRSAASLSKVWRAGGPNSPEPESQGAPSRSSSVADGSSPHVSVSHCLPPLFMPLLPLIQQAQ